jgi:hypothetical protein
MKRMMKMNEFEFIKCVVCELKWPKPALDKWGVCPICYKGGGGIPPLQEESW